MRERTLEVDFEKRLDREGVSPAQALRRSRRQALAWLLAAVAAGAAGAGFYAWMSGANGSGPFMSTTATVNQVTVLQQAVSSLFAGQAGYDLLTEQTLIDSKMIPAGMISGGAIMHAFGGRAEVMPTEDGYSFMITLRGLPTGACNGLSIQKMASQAFMTRVSNTAGLTTDSPGVPFSIKQAAAACGKQGVSADITWTFR